VFHVGLAANLLNSRWNSLKAWSNNTIHAITFRIRTDHLRALSQ
jgi:hypothetical protein